MRRAGAALCAAILLTGCHSVVAHATLPVAKDTATLTVTPYWTTQAGEQVVVSGLEVQLSQAEVLLASQTTWIDQGMAFYDLPPGEYTVAVLASAETVVCHSFWLEAGTILALNFDLKALEEAGEPPADRVARGNSVVDDVLSALGDVFYYLGMGVLMVGVAGLAVAAAHPELVVVAIAAWN